ncbi:TonB-dependent receptor plug domain-containing protein [Oceanipulchritudo coccoides]|nr:TonB-dependent receptor plug domain-containing protein [Oceanipulchritudo coccoides]
MKAELPRLSLPLLMALLVLATNVTTAQDAVVEDEADDDVFDLSPFVVEEDGNVGYTATQTLGGTRIRTQLEDVAASVSVITADFLEDTGATDNQSLLQYTANTEVGGVDGNFGGAGDGPGVYESFGNPSNETRVRGLAAADNTRNYFLSDIPWDVYIVERVDIQRGPNAILFGFGSPAGIINTGLIKPQMADKYKIQVMTDSNDSIRGNFDFNKVILENELAVRVAGVKEREKFRQDPAFENDERIWAGAEWQPDFLKKKWSRTTFNIYYEDGSIDSNYPRTITPIDRISPWFRPVRTVENDLTSPFNPEGGVGRQFFTASQLWNNRLPPTPNAGQIYSYYEDGSPNPYHIPSLGSFGAVYGGPAGFVADPATGVVTNSQILQYREKNGLGPDGQIDGKIDGNYFEQPSSIDTFNEFARKAGLPFAEFGQYKQKTFTDRSVFDFYNNLLDGPNKEEGQEFDNLNISWRQTFLDNKFGFELSKDKQSYYNYSTRLLVDDRQAILVDVTETLIDGTPNPNVGRPFISDSGQFGNWSYERDRDVTRFTAFAEHDFNDYKDSFLNRLLGRQNLTFLLSREEAETRNLSWQMFAMGQDYRDFMGNPSIVDNVNAFSPVVYLGPSVIGADSVSDVQIQPLKSRIQIPDEVSIRFWDDTWNAPSVNPGDSWQHPGGYLSTQSENPANYVGWNERSFSIEKVGPRNPEALARAGSLTRGIVDSEALVLQNYFWDGAVVGTYGWRRDEVRAYNTNAYINPVTQRAEIEKMVLPSSPNNEWEQETSSWSAVVHLHRLPWFMDILPINVSLYYNESENFQPNANRLDLFGRAHDPAIGDTVDRSVLLQTKDGKYSLKATHYTTKVTNASSDYLYGQWFLGNFQAWGENWKNIFELDTIQGTDGTGRTIFNTYAPRAGQTQADARAEEAAAVEGWKQHIENLRALSAELTGNPDAFDQAYQLDRSNTTYNGITVTEPAGFTITEDVESEGWEFEFTARPTKDWDITFNASKVESTRTNWGDEALIRYIDLVNDDLNNTDAGMLRIYGGWPSAPTALTEWNSILNGNYQFRKQLEGNPAPEIRKWRFNLVTNYHFVDGFLSGINIGGGYRWQDKVIIGFEPEYTDESMTSMVYNLDKPYYGPSESNIDLWIGYYKRIGDWLDWHVQLNVRNVFADKDLIPINTHPDGTVGAWRLGAATTWTITNTFTW